MRCTCWTAGPKGVRMAQELETPNQSCCGMDAAAGKVLQGAGPVPPHGAIDHLTLLGLLACIRHSYGKVQDAMHWPRSAGLHASLHCLPLQPYPRCLREGNAVPAGVMYKWLDWIRWHGEWAGACRNKLWWQLWD